MHLLMLSDDEIQAHVIAAAASRRGFVTSVRALAPASACSPCPEDRAASVTIVDCEYLDHQVTDFVNELSECRPGSRVFVLAERVASSDIALGEAVRFVQLKPFHVTDFLN